MRKYLFLFLLLMITILPGCSYFEAGNLQNVGMLLDSTIEEDIWTEKGYDSLMKIEEEFDIDVFYEENVTTERDVQQAVAAFVEEGVNLIIGHSNIYGSYFIDLSTAYPDIHFIYTNGAIYNDSVTSLNFNSHAMGFFGGMVAGEMTRSNEIGVIAVYSWQPELEGFYEGVKYQNPEARLQIDFVNNWSDVTIAMNLYEKFKNEGIDIIYPVGNSFTEPIIEAAAEDSIYSIGYIADQQDVAPEYVLTSTIQDIDKLYVEGVAAFESGKLDGGVQTFDFDDGFISLGTFNEKVPKNLVEEIEEAIETYTETGLLPNE
ncbi:BMP family ABC transporter substrate-binding protein [Oceanobacillus sp. CAU 1775]